MQELAQSRLSSMIKLPGNKHGIVKTLQCYIVKNMQDFTSHRNDEFKNSDLFSMLWYISDHAIEQMMILNQINYGNVTVFYIKIVEWLDSLL